MKNLAGGSENTFGTLCLFLQFHIQNPLSRSLGKRRMGQIRHSRCCDGSLPFNEGSTARVGTFTGDTDVGER